MANRLLGLDDDKVGHAGSKELRQPLSPVALLRAKVHVSIQVADIGDQRLSAVSTTSWCRMLPFGSRHAEHANLDVRVASDVTLHNDPLSAAADARV